MDTAQIIITAAYPNNAFRFCINPAPSNSFPEDLPLQKVSGTRRVPVHKDAQGMFRAHQRNLKFVFDPPTGNFKLSGSLTGRAGRGSSGEILSGRALTGAFSAPGLFFRHGPRDDILGFGAAPKGASRGPRRFRLMNVDTMFYAVKGGSYSSMPFFIIRGEAGHYLGVFIASAVPADVLIDHSENTADGPGTRFSFLSDEPMPVDVFVFQGSPGEILRSYADITGRPFLPPLWSLGFHQSRWSYKTAARVQALAERFRAEDVPCDAVHLDIHYMDRYRVFTWHPKRFPDPRELHNRLEQLGMRTVAIVDPGVSAQEGYGVYETGKQREFFCGNSRGDFYSGKVWPGKTVFPDFTREDTRDWWAENHAPLFQAGVSGIWNDMNEPVLKIGYGNPLEEDISHGDTPHFKVRNLYANQEASATRQAFRLYKPGKRAFILTRGAFAGIQSRAAVWTGDNHSTWEHLRENLRHVIHLGLSGVPFSGADVGGFAGGKGRLGVFKFFRDRELFTRWMELGSLMPFFRAHTVLYSRDQEPWSMGHETLQLVRKHIKRRYRLLPYIYNLFRESHETGTPIVRPLYLEFPDSQQARDADDQFMLGPSLLAAPVLRKGARVRDVFLPPGDWFEFETGKQYQGNATYKINTAPGYYPLFVREGTVLPVCRARRNAHDSLFSELILEVYPAPEMSGRVYLDDGESLNAETDGKYYLLEIEGTMKADRHVRLNLTVRHKKFTPPFKSATIRMPPGYRAVPSRGASAASETESLADEDRRITMLSRKISLQSGKLDFQYDGSGS